MKNLLTATMLAVSICTAALVCSGCRSSTEETAAPQAAPQMSPEAAKAAEDAMRRDKRGY